MTSGASIGLVTSVPGLATVDEGLRPDTTMEGLAGHKTPFRPHGRVTAGNASPLTDGATEGQSILALNGGVILRGEAGVETAIASGGFVFVGTDTAGEDDLWRFYNVTRGRDYIHLMFLRTLRFYLGRFNINGQTIAGEQNVAKFVGEVEPLPSPRAIESIAADDRALQLA